MEDFDEKIFLKFQVIISEVNEIVQRKIFQKKKKRKRMPEGWVENGKGGDSHLLIPRGVSSSLK